MSRCQSSRNPCAESNELRPSLDESGTASMHGKFESGPISADHVAPSTILLKVECCEGVQLLLRKRPPGEVTLRSGQLEHMLVCNVGRGEPGVEAKSSLQTGSESIDWHSLPTGQVTFVPAGTPLIWKWTYHSESVHLILTPQFMQQIKEQLSETLCAAALRDAPLKPLFREVNEPLRRLLLMLREEAKLADAAQGQTLSSLVNLVGVQLCREMARRAEPQSRSQPTLSPRELRHAVDFIESRLSVSVDIAEVAKECGLSPSHFARAFKGSVGCPPHEYQLRRRIQYSQDLLVHAPRRTVSEIAVELGFADESHFRRHFKRIVGVTPGQFRR